MHLLQKIWNFYKDGFLSMKVGKKLWVIIAIKFFLFFVVMKLFFFPNYLQEHFQTDQERSNHILNQLIQGRE